MAYRRVPDAALKMLEALGPADSTVAVEVLGMLLLALEDRDYNLTGQPGRDKPEFGFDLAIPASPTFYTLTVTNCSAVSMQKFNLRTFRHELVHDIAIDNYGVRREDRKGATIDVTMVRVSAAPQGHARWSGVIMPPRSEDVAGLLVPPQSRQDALQIIGAVRAHCENHWTPTFNVAEENAPRSTAPGFRITAEPMRNVTMSFYAHLDAMLGLLEDGTTRRLRTIVVAPCTFNDGAMHGLVVSVFCHGRPPKEDRAPRGRDSDRASAALGVRGHAMSKPPRPSASVFSAIGRLFGRSKDDADE